MSANTQTTVAPVAEAAKAEAPKAPAFVFAPVTPDDARDAAVETVRAVVACEKAKRTLLLSVAEAVEAIGCALTSAQYDKQFGPYLTDAFAAAVKGNKLKEATAKSYASKMKTAVLAILSKAAEPLAGETFWEFYDRAAPLLASATIQQGDQQVPVWVQSSKTGPKAGSGNGKGSRKSGGPVPAAVADANASAATSGESGFNRDPKTAAALILTKGNESRAKALVAVMANYPEQFDRWASGLLATDNGDKAEAPKAETLKPGQPATAMADALAKAHNAKLAKSNRSGMGKPAPLAQAS